MSEENLSEAVEQIISGAHFLGDLGSAFAKLDSKWLENEEAFASLLQLNDLSIDAGVDVVKTLLSDGVDPVKVFAQSTLFLRITMQDETLEEQVAAYAVNAAAAILRLGMNEYKNGANR